MIICGLDPGLERVGFGFIEYKSNKCSYIYHGIIKTKSSNTLQERLSDIQSDLTFLFQKYKPDAFAIESLFFNKNTTTAMLVAQARGVILLNCHHYSQNITSYTPLQIKSNVCGYGFAKKDQVQYMVKQLLNLAFIPKPDDAADALAVAICHTNHIQIKSSYDTLHNR